MADQRSPESLWLEYDVDIDEVYEDERKAYSFDLSYLPLIPGSIKLNGVASLVDQQGLTKYNKPRLLQRVKHPDGSSREVPIKVTGKLDPGATSGGSVAGASDGAGASAEMRRYVITGPQRRVESFNASSIITFGDLRRNIQELFTLFRQAEFDVYIEADYQKVNKQKRSESLLGLELQANRWKAHLDRLPSATTPARVVIRARGKPFSEYNKLPPAELQQLVMQRTGLVQDNGQPDDAPDKFNPPPGFAASARMLLHWGKRGQQAESPSCSTPFEVVAAGQGTLAAGRNTPATGQDARQDAPAAGQDAPAAGQDAPAAGQDAPAAGQGAPAAGQGAPAAGQGAPAAGQGAPAAGQGAPAAGQGAPAAGQGAPAAGQGAPAAGQGALAAGRSRGGGEAVPAQPDSRQHEDQGVTLKFGHVVKALATSMICLVRSIRSEEIGPEVLHKGFIDLVLAGALELAKAVEPRSSGQNVYLEAEPALAGFMAWGMVDYMLKYRTIGIMVAEAKTGNLDDAWGQAFMEMCAMRDAIVHRLRHQQGQERGEQTTSKGQKRTAAEAFVVDTLSSYALICTASRYRLVLHEPSKGLWRSEVMTLPLLARTTPEQLATPLEELVRMLAYAITRQMKWVDDGLTHHPALDKSLPEFSGADVEAATKDYFQDLQALEEEDHPPA